MTLTLAIIINVSLGVVLLCLLAFVMSRVGKLTPHVACTPDAGTSAAEHAARLRARRRAGRGPVRRQPVLD